MKLSRSLFALLLVSAVSACATTENGRSHHGASAASAPASDLPYPAWTRVTGWLLTPFTGASASVGF